MCPTGMETFPIVIAWCDGPEDCADGTRCLIQLGSTGNFPQCGCHGTPGSGCAERWSYVLCHDLGDCPSWATRCATEELLAGHYTVCRE